MIRGRQTWSVYKKEMVDALRDRRAIFTMLFLPILLYPLLIVGVIQIRRAETATQNKQPLRLAVLIAGSAAMSSDAQAKHPLLRKLAAADRIELSFPDEDATALIPKLEAGEFEAILHVDKELPTRLRELAPSTLELYYDETEPRSTNAKKKITAIAEEVSLEALAGKLQEFGLQKESATPLSVESENVASPQKMGGFLLGSVFSYLLLFVTILGAYYPAIDLGAGERERGTLETLVVSPLRRSEICTGKFLAIFTFSTVTAMLNLGSLLITFRYGFELGQPAGGDASLQLRVDPFLMLLIPLMILPFAAIFSALMLLISFFARTYKEAQTYLSPVLLLTLLPMIAVMLPSSHLTLSSAPVPLLNLCLLFKDLLLGEGEWIEIGVVLVSNTFYAAVLLWLAMRAFAREQLLDGSESLWTGFLATFRR